MVGKEHHLIFGAIEVLLRVLSTVQHLSTLTIVTPIYRDSYLAKAFLEAVRAVDWGGITLAEVIFVVDGSGARDEEEMKKIAQGDTNVKVLVLSRNFGQHVAVSAGFKEAKSSMVCMINVDCQDPPASIPALAKHLIESKVDVVYGLRQERSDPFFKRLTSTIFNLTLNWLTGDNTPINVATVRVMSKRFIDAYNSLSEKSRYLPGLENWLGFEKAYVPVNHQARVDGGSSYNFKSRLKMAVDSIISFSDLPLRTVAFFGFALTGIGFLFICALIVLKITMVDFQSGWASTVSIIVFVGGIQIAVTGLASLYIGRILREVQNRPLFIIKEVYKTQKNQN